MLINSIMFPGGKNTIGMSVTLSMLIVCACLICYLPLTALVRPPVSTQSRVTKEDDFMGCCYKTQTLAPGHNPYSDYRDMTQTTCDSDDTDNPEAAGGRVNQWSVTNCADLKQTHAKEYP